MANVNLIETPQPHFIPGYTGYCPQYIFRVGDTYGSLTHKLIIDPCVPRAENIVLSDRGTDDYPVYRPTLREIDLIRDRGSDGAGVYKHPMIPGYEGFVPRINGKLGQRFSVLATEGLAEFERFSQIKRAQSRKLKHRGVLQSTWTGQRSLGERSLQSNDYRLPLKAVRPDAQGIVREIPDNMKPRAPPLPYSKVTPPHFMDNENEEKYLKLGYSGKKPFTFPHFGQNSKTTTKSGLCEFTNDYQYRRGAEWAPLITVGCGVSVSKPSGPMDDIYHKHVGLIPNYAGHVPGSQFRFGQTFGNDSRDAKRCCRNEH